VQSTMSMKLLLIACLAVIVLAQKKPQCEKFKTCQSCLSSCYWCDGSCVSPDQYENEEVACTNGIFDKATCKGQTTRISTVFSTDKVKSKVSSKVSSTDSYSTDLSTDSFGPGSCISNCACDVDDFCCVPEAADTDQICQNVMDGFCVLKCDGVREMTDPVDCYDCVADKDSWCGENVWDQYCMDNMDGKCVESCGLTSGTEHTQDSCKTQCVCAIDEDYCCSQDTFDESCENVLSGYCTTVCEKIGNKPFPAKPVTDCFDVVADFDAHCAAAVWDEHCWNDAAKQQECKGFISR